MHYLKKYFPLFILIALPLLIPEEVSAQTKSRIVGTVKDDQTGEALIGANILVVGTKLGAVTDIDGKYYIINVPVGTYQIQASMLGYGKKTVADLIVSADRVSEVNFALLPQTIGVGEVIVTAERNALHKEVSNTQLVATSDQIANSVGVREINAFLEKQPGVTRENGFLTIRGGSADQTGTMVNGLSYNNAANGNAETTIPMSAIEQVSLLSGGYNAEYGNFRSGLINVVTKSGTKDQYHATVSMSRNIAHQKRFGPAFSDPKGPLLAPYLDADVAFVGTAAGWAGDSVKLRQHQGFSFPGWTSLASQYNQGKAAKDQVTPMDLYLFAAWMHCAVPDYEGLAKLGYTVSDQQKKLFAEHMYNEEGSDSNIDFGFGGPIPFISSELGDATFYLSHNSRETFYIMPVTRRSDENSVTLATIKSTPISDLTISFNGLYRKQTGISPIRPAFGDFPDASRSGGFMPEDNISQYARVGDGVYSMYFYDMGFYPILYEKTWMGGTSINYVFDKTTFCELSLSYLNTRDDSPTGDTRDNTIITNFGPILVSEMPYGKLEYSGGGTGSGSNKLTLISGSDTMKYTHASYDAVLGIPRRFRGKEGDLYTKVNTNQYRAKFDLNSQLDNNNYFKAGFEYNLIDIDHNLWEKWNNNATNTYEFRYHRKPSQTGLYLQDQMSYESLIANIGVRFDYYYGGGGKWPSGSPFAIDAFGPLQVDSTLFPILESGRSLVWEYWEAYDKLHPGFLTPVKNFLTVSPRIGVSFPITEKSKFYFNYGHFRSNPPYYSMYLLRYRYTKEGLNDLPSPNMEPPKTVSYELGFAYNFFDSFIATISGYSKDVTGENGKVTYQTTLGTQSNLDYDSWKNNKYEDVQGLELNITKNDPSWITGWFNFNYMLKKSGLTGQKLFTDVPMNDEQTTLYAGNESRTLPLPRLSANVTFRSPSDFGTDLLGSYLLGNWSLSLFMEWMAGNYFTWNPLNNPHLSSNMQWPDYSMIDMRMSKTFSFYGLNTTFFVDVNNIFNIKVSLLSKQYAFNPLTDDFQRYMASLRLPMYNSPEYDALRASNPGSYVSGSDKIGDLRSPGKDYIDDPNFSYWIYGQPRDIWFGIRMDF
jgi:outer membrane receptor protein involved in Fe transport